MIPQRIGVVGAGMMGSEIALVFALAGQEVRLSDTNEERLNTAMGNLAKLLEKGATRGLWPAEEVAPTLARIRPTLDLADHADREMVIEAVFEDETIKADVFRRLEQVCAADCMLASNTSSISITVLSGYVAPMRRQYFLGTHFFSPVSRMKLVEIIPGLDTAPQTVEAAMAACRAAGKTPIQVKDVVGFAVNRLLHGFLIEAMRLVEEGVASLADIDTACKLGLGHPIGPFEMMDIVSNSLVLQVQEVMAAAYGDRFHPSMLLKKMVKTGYDGKKVGRGWHRWAGEESDGVDPPAGRG
ncbi:MAG: 3-hydroxyacyl-CoA dehydrogenase family protein [Xanthobacteraceae bacterium]